MALATGGLVTGCDSDAKIAKSAAGESCDKTSDCNEGLKCLEGTCYKSATNTGGSANNEGGEGNSTAGTTVVGPKPPVLGGEGESCTRRADCEDGLACLSQRCQKNAATGMGGEGSGGPALGGIGETCGLTSDCEEGLACLPSDRVAAPPPVDTLAIGSNSVGVCSPVDNGLTPTGNVCGGECKTAADCCELPVAVHVPYAVTNTPGVSGPYGVGANSCTELAALLDGINCATTKVVAEQVKCFAQTAYCECGTKTWACNDAGRCEYNAACVAATVGSITGGCPTYTRLGLPTPTTTCSKAKKCVPEAVAGCTANADCDETMLIAEGTEYCTNGKCTCDTDSGKCYRSCSEDLDCPVHFTCDTKTDLCRAGDQCETNSFCVTTYNDINSKCVAGTCTSSCNNDLDCNGGVLTNYDATMVCNAEHVCEKVGCAADNECPAVGSVRAFCVKAPEATATGGVVSAITD
jgi:hypothetical protein